MGYISVSDFAKKYDISDSTFRNYCAVGKIDGAFLTGKTWNIPEDAFLPSRKKSQVAISPLLKVLREQKSMKLKGGIYHRTQIDQTYNSNHIEGSRLMSPLPITVLSSSFFKTIQMSPVFSIISRD